MAKPMFPGRISGARGMGETPRRQDRQTRTPQRHRNEAENYISGRAAEFSFRLWERYGATRCRVFRIQI
jgi:hypothetical protein